MKTLSNGRILPSEVKPIIPQSQEITGSPIDAATKKTLDSQEGAANAAKQLGVGQKGGRRRTRRRKNTRRRKQRGGEEPNMNAKIPKLPEAGTIPGVSFANNHMKANDLLNQIRSDKAGDSLTRAKPVQMGGSKKKRSTRRRIR
jgi:hypothetical protein